MKITPDEMEDLLDQSPAPAGTYITECGGLWIGLDSRSGVNVTQDCGDEVSIRAWLKSRVYLTREEIG